MVRFGFAVVGEGRVLDTERVKASPFAVHCSPKLRGLALGERWWPGILLTGLLVIANFP